MLLRGPDFVRAYNSMNTLLRSNLRMSTHGRHNVCMFHIGACAPGMNTTVRAVVRMAISKNFCCYAALNGIDGLQNGNLREVSHSCFCSTLHKVNF
jgi:6-phosphofructokinase 1